jgi:hypothetical protein
MQKTPLSFKTTLIVWLFSLIMPTVSFSQNHLILPNHFNVQETAISLSRNYAIFYKEKNIGSLKKFQKPYEHYALFDENNQKLTEVTSHVLSQTTYFEILDDKRQKLGMLEEYFHASFPSFNIYLGENKFPAASAKMNFWGTTFSIKDALTHQEIAEMSRPYLRLKNEWTIRIKEPIVLDKKRIDPKLLLSIIALQCDENNWQPKYIQQPLSMSTSKINTTIQSLDQEFYNYLPSDDEDDQLYCHHYEKFCLDKIHAPDLDAQTKKSIKLLLMNRLKTLKAAEEYQYQ